MKALKVFVTIFCCVVVPVMGNEVIKGTVVDTFTNLPIAKATVKTTSPLDSVLTDSLGNFSLTIITTGIKNPMSKPVWNQERGLIFSGSDKTQIEIINLQGVNISANAFWKSGWCDLPPGLFMIVIKDQGKTNVLKIMNAKSGMRITANAGSSSRLAKAMANYSVSFHAAGYNPVTRSVAGNTSFTQKLVPSVLVGSIMVNATVGKIGSVSNNGAAVFALAVQPNRLIVTIAPITGGKSIMDTVRNFTISQAASKTYSVLSGLVYSVSAVAEDSTNPGVAVNQPQIDSVTVNTDAVDTVNLNLPAVVAHFSAKFPPCSSAVKVQTLIKALNSSSGNLPTWIDSLVIAKGKKDTSVIARNLPLSAAPNVSNYSIRFRIYGDSGVVLYEGTDSSVAVAPGADVPYVVNLNQIVQVPTGSILVNTFVQKIGSIYDGSAVSYAGMIQPNWLIIRISQTNNGAIQPVCDTVRNFVVGQVYSKVYANLPSGVSYMVGAYTMDSANLSMAANAYTISENNSVLTGKTDTVNFPNLYAVATHFSAKIPPCSAAVKMQVFIQELNTQNGYLRAFTDSLIITKGKKDSTVITRNLELANAPGGSNYSIRFRAYGDGDTLLYEGFDSLVSVGTSADVAYSVSMHQVMQVPAGALCVNAIIQRMGGMTNGTTAFNSLVEPNQLVIQVIQYATSSYVVSDTIRNFTLGQTFSKTYSKLPSGLKYGINVGARDSVSGVMLAGALGVDLTIGLNETDTANLSAGQSCANFTAGFPEIDSAVKLEASVTATNGYYYEYLPWVASLTIPQGKKDSSFVTQMIILTNSPGTSTYNVRLRAYSSSGAVLYEGNATNVAVAPGADVTYVADLQPVAGSGLSKRVAGMIRN